MTNLWLPKEKWGEGQIKSLELTYTHTTKYKVDNQDSYQGPTLQHRELDSLFCNNLK